MGKNSKRGLTLIFAATRHHVEYLTLLLSTSGLPATQIYGNMDNMARQHNLRSFMSGECPILVVTDVAARGIDIPLIDHVIHYAFPPSAKLFIHRSGRAARAGRIGYCWGIVDPEEMPYMVDLHLFLGRKMSNGRVEKSETNGDANSEETKKEDETGKDEEPTDGADAREKEGIFYTLDEMTPEMVHFGSVPESVLVEEVENVRRMVDSELAGSHDAELLRMMTRVCNNAMKQYRRSRPEASRQGVRRAKALLEGEKETGTGRRVLNSHGGIPSHPLLRLIEMEKLKATLGQNFDSTGGKISAAQMKRQEDMAKKKMSDLQKRQDFLRAMANFRPKETVFEAFATGGQKDIIHNSQVDKYSNGGGAALVAMKSMRRQMKIARDKGGSLVIAGSKSALTLNGEEEEGVDEVDGPQQQDNVENDDGPADVSNKKTDEEEVMPSAKPSTVNVECKRRLSKAERKKMKKNPNYKPSSNGDEAPKKAKGKRGADFRDDMNYIDNDATQDTAAAARSRQIEAAMQPSASSNAKGSSALAYRIEENMLDIVGDENVDLVKRQRMMRWDKSKRKYIQTTVGEELSGDSKSKKIRLESGQLVKNDKAKLGELYEKWQKKTNRSIGRVGVFDDVTEDVSPEVAAAAIKKGRKGDNGKKRSNEKDNGDDEMKTVSAIRKEREKKDKNSLKNMEKNDRRQLVSKQRSERTAAQEGKGKKGKKGGPKGRWQGSQKKGGKR